jgi:6-phosphofructokinase 2
MGDLMKDLLDKEGIDQRPVEIEGWTRLNTVVLERASGKQYRFGKPGSELNENELKACIEEVGSVCCHCAYLVASGSLPPGSPADFYARVARIAEKKGTRLVLDTSGSGLRLAAEAGVFMLKPNLRELGHLAGRNLEKRSEQIDAAREIIRRGSTRAVVISMGDLGALLVTKESQIEVEAPKVRVKSRVGAGDSMVAGITLALSRGADFGQALRLGVASGTAAVMTPGTELCRREDVERLRDSLEQSA